MMEKIAGMYGLLHRSKQPFYLWDHTTIRRIEWTSLLSMKRFLGAWRRYGFPTILYSKCGAEYLRVKNHYLGFYPREGKVIKIFLDRGAYQKHVEGGVRLNEYGFDSISSPQVQISSYDPIPHTVEELVPGRNYLEVELPIPKTFFKDLVRFHFDHPEIIEISLSKQEREKINSLLQDLNFTQHQVSWIKQLLDKGSWLVAAGEVHGDLSPGNIILGGDRLYITDWEGYTRGPIAQDLVKLYREAGSETRSWILEMYQMGQDKAVGIDKADDFRSALLLFMFRVISDLHSTTSAQYTDIFNDQNLAMKKTEQVQIKHQAALESLLGSWQSGN
jgi:hypothetical protein